MLGINGYYDRLCLKCEHLKSGIQNKSYEFCGPSCEYLRVLRQEGVRRSGAESIRAPCEDRR